MNLGSTDSMKFQSVARYVNLPPLRNLNSSENIFAKNESNFNQIGQKKQQYETASFEVKAQVQALKGEIVKNILIFNDPDTFQFKFPIWLTPKQTKSSVTHKKYQNQNQDYGTFSPTLSSQQIESIKNTGFFEVKRQRNEPPDIWEMNDWIFRGKQRRSQIWANGLAWCANKSKQSFNYFVENIPKSVGLIAEFPEQLFDLLFGKRAMQKDKKNDLRREVQKDFWTEIINNELKNPNNQCGYAFLNILYIEVPKQSYERQQGSSLQDQKRHRQINQIYNKRVAQVDNIKYQILKMQTQFRNIWSQQKRSVLQQFERSFGNQNQQVIEQKIHREKFRQYQIHLRSRIPQSVRISPEALDSLIILAIIIQIIKDRRKIKQKKLTQIYKNTTKEVEDDNPILSKISWWRQEKINKLTTERGNQFNQKFFQSLIRDPQLVRFLPASSIIILKKYIEYSNSYDMLINEKKRQALCLYYPSRTFVSTYKVLPPYEIVKNNQYYKMIKQKQMKINTSTYFWKVKLYCMRLFTWTINFIVTLIFLAWLGPLGLRSLFGVSDYTYEQYLADSSQSHVVSQLKHSTVYGRFSKVIDGIRESRNSFQSRPDTGILGKFFTRLCNLFQCYVIRFLLIGVIGVLILNTCLVLISSTVCAFMLATFYIWVPLAMILCYLFNLLIFQFEFSINRGLTINAVPLISLALRIIFSFGFIVFLTLLLFIITPVLCLLYFLFLVLQRIWRTFTDAIVGCVIARFGRTPSTNSYLAKRVTGQGKAQTLTESIQEEQFDYSISLKLDSIFINRLQKLTSKIINDQQRKSLANFNYLIKQLKLSRSSQNISVVTNNTSKLEQRINKSFQSQHSKSPPCYPSVAFSRQQLQVYFSKAMTKVIDFVRNHRFDLWIFEELSVPQGNFQEFTKKLFKSIFSQNIFESLEDIDKRILASNNLRTNRQVFSYASQYISSITNNRPSIVSTNTINFTPKPIQSVYDLEDGEIAPIQTIFYYHNRNNSFNISFVPFQIQSGLIGHQNLYQLKQYDQFTKKQRQKQLKTIYQDYVEEDFEYELINL